MYYLLSLKTFFLTFILTGPFSFSAPNDIHAGPYTIVRPMASHLHDRLICGPGDKCVYPADSVPWKFTTRPHQRIIAVGDLHGDIDSLTTILDHFGILPHEEHTENKRSHILIQVGDNVDRGPHSKKVLDYFMTHDSQSGDFSSQVMTVLGNHDIDLLKGRLYGLSQADIDGFRKALRPRELEKSLNDEDVLVHTFLRPSPYSLWLSRQNAIIQIDQRFFVHASLPKELIYFDPGQINTTIRRWLAFRIGIGPRPDSRTEWVFGHDGPFNNVHMQLGKERDYLSQIFSRYHAKQVVVGHIPYARGGDISHHTSEVEVNGPVLRIDTGISLARYDLGFLAAFEIHQDKVSMQKFPAPVCTRAL